MNNMTRKICLVIFCLVVSFSIMGCLVGEKDAVIPVGFQDVNNITGIEYSFDDGTNCVLKGSSANGKKWPKGFDELRATLDGIVQARADAVKS